MVDPRRPIHCSLCGLDETQASFTASQRKKATKHQGTAKCTQCIEAVGLVGSKIPSSVAPTSPPPSTPPATTITTTNISNDSIDKTKKKKDKKKKDRKEKKKKEKKEKKKKKRTADTTTTSADTPLHHPTSPDEANSDDIGDDDNNGNSSSRMDDEGEPEVSMDVIVRKGSSDKSKAKNEQDTNKIASADTPSSPDWVGTITRKKPRISKSVLADDAADSDSKRNLDSGGDDNDDDDCSSRTDDEGEHEFSIDVDASKASATKKEKRNQNNNTTKRSDISFDPTSPDLEKTIPRKKRKISNSFLFDDEAMSDGNDTDDEGDHDVSIAAIKREVLGRDLHVETPVKERDDLEDELAQIRQLTFHSTASTISLADRLHSDMLCAICRDIHYPPISLYCGHSFCQECLEWWEKTSPTCPTCRADIVSGGGHTVKFPQINGSLKQCLLGLYPSQVEQKLKSQKKTMIGENNGQHSRGYQVLSPLKDEFWHTVATTPAIKARRNIVLDGEDQRMQLALGLHQVPTPLSNGLIVPLCLLTMEEDEANDSGFPIVVSTHVEDEQFLCTNENRFRQSYLLVEMTKEDGSIAPVGRLSLQAMTMQLPGFVEYVLDASTCTFHAEARVLRFHHDDTGAILELDLSLLQKGATSASFVSMDQRQRQQRQQRQKQQAMVMEQLDDEEEDHYDHEEDDDDDEQGHDLDDFEEDSFVVQEEETSDKEGEFSGDEEHGDNEEGCVYCKDGGELMICDGGTEMDGCGKSFHYECVNLPCIPEGDWICSDCAKEGGYPVDGRRGHEFPLPPKNDNGIQTKRVLSDDDSHSSSSSSSSSEDEKPADNAETKDKDIGGNLSSQTASDKNNKKPSKRRIVLEDTDDED